MITGFEGYTQELSEYEINSVLPRIYSVLHWRKGEELAIRNNEVVYWLKNNNIKTTEPRIRKILHIIRTSGMIKGVVATSKGYYIANTEQEWEKYIVSINERIDHITTLKNAIIEQYRGWSEKQNLTEN